MATIQKSNQPEKLHKHHYIRTPIAAILGIVALILVILFVLSAWANRTLTDTNTYVSTVAPLAEDPAVQNFLATQLSQAITKEGPIDKFAQQILDKNIIDGKTVDQLRPLVQEQVKQEVIGVVSSPDFAVFWEDSNRSIHESLVSQLNSNTDQIDIDFTNILNGAIAQLDGTTISPIKDEIKLEPGKATLHIAGSDITRIHSIYNGFKNSMYVLLALVAVLIALSVMISVHHAKTVRRISLASGVIFLIMFGLLKAPAFVTLGDNPGTNGLVKALTQQIFANLQTTLLLLGIFLIIAPIFWKVIELITKRKK